MKASVGILTVSGACLRGESEELINNAAVRALSHAGYDSITTMIVRDDFTLLKSALIELCESCDIVFTAGGTGFAPTDFVPEATSAILERQANGLAELIRLDAHKHSETSHLNRGVAGIRGKTVVINLPGSTDAVKAGIETVALLLRPMLSSLRGETELEHAG
jgi:molybdopterin adenylyltransferase